MLTGTIFINNGRLWVFSEARDRLKEARLLRPFSCIEQRNRGQPAQMIWFKGFIGAGELSLFGWLTVIFYFSTAMSCWITARKLQARAIDIEDVKELRVWTSVSAAFLALGITKLLGLDTALTGTIRSVARFQGWYGQRQIVQIAFMVGVAVICMIAAFMMPRWVPRAPASTSLALHGPNLLSWLRAYAGRITSSACGNLLAPVKNQ